MKRVVLLLLTIYYNSTVYCSIQHVNGNEEIQQDTNENLDTSLSIETNHENQQIDSSETTIPIIDSKPNDNLDVTPSPPPDNFPDYVKMKSENYHVGDVSVELNIEYKLESYNNFYIYGAYESRINNAYTTDNFFQYQFRDVVEQETQTVKGSIKVIVQLPTELIYYDHQNKSIPTNYFANEIKFESRLVITDPQDGFEVTSVEMDSHSLTVPDPWNRKQRPLYSLNWYLYLLEIMKDKSVPKCNHHSSKFNKVFCEYFGIIFQCNHPYFLSLFINSIYNTHSIFHLFFISISCEYVLTVYLKIWIY